MELFAMICKRVGTRFAIDLQRDYLNNASFRGQEPQSRFFSIILRHSGPVTAMDGGNTGNAWSNFQ
jgi:hypothetical protein